MRTSLSALIPAVFALLDPALAKPGPANVVVIANTNSALSRNIAEYYSRARHIPRGQVCYLNAPVDEAISRDTFDRLVRAPIAQFLKAGKLEESTLYLVTTQGVPLKIGGSASGMMDDGASVDSELTLLYQEMKGQKHELKGPLSNPYFKAIVDFNHPRFPIYLVTRLAAWDFSDVKQMIDRSLAARNRGNFVIDLKGDAAPDDEGNGWLRDAMIQLPTPRTIFDDGRKVLEGIPNVIGYASWGSNDIYRKNRFLKMGWLPGAIATEFVSTNARTFIRPPDSWNIGPWSNQQAYYAGAPQTLSADLIHEGATGASGHVNEPFLQFCPRPQYVLPAYLKGEPLAEAFYRGIPAVSWMNVVLGDPLCSLGPP